MAIKIGTTAITSVGKIKLGTTNIQKVYQGTNQIFPVTSVYSFVTAGITSSSGSGACNINFDPILNFNLYSSVATPDVGSTMYTNNTLTTVCDGGSQWYRIGGSMDGATYQINNLGIIINAYNCGF